MNYLVDVRCAGVPISYLSPRRGIGMRVPDRILNCVGFIAHESPVVRFIGTGFAVGIKTPLGNWALYLITARHVAEAVDPAPFLIGINLKTGRKAEIQSGDESCWIYHPTDASVDAAAYPFPVESLKKHSLEWIPEDMFATDERIQKYNIGIGDEITCPGLYTRFTGAAKHTPILRSGTVAMMSHDRIPLKRYGPAEVYLAEGRSIGGLSGSPVFVRDTQHIQIDTEDETQRLYGLGSFHLLGLIHGHWELPIGFEGGEQPAAVNEGISIIVPATKILDILLQPKCEKMRRQYDETVMEDNAPTAD